MITTPPANINSLWADLVVEQLCRIGVSHFVVCPGSRSTPLVAAVAARSDAEVTVHYDERGAAFYALGHARATGRPAVWLTTSGTAVANGMPAVVEASRDGVPMLLLTADRPPELRATGANQSIDQVKIFGDYVRWFFDMPCPSRDIDPRMVLSVTAEAVAWSIHGKGGPVHVNCMYREPLAPVPDGEDYASYLGGLGEWLAGRDPLGVRPVSQLVPTTDAIDSVAAQVADAHRGLLVVGSLGSAAEQSAVSALAASLGWPVLPDVTSGYGAAEPGIVNHDLLLASDSFSKQHRPDLVLHLGGRPTSKRLIQLMSEGRLIQVAPSPERRDQDHRATMHICGDLVAVCEALVPLVHGLSDEGWLSKWRTASEKAERAVEDCLSVDPSLNEPWVAREVSRILGDGAALVISNSMPVRDMNAFRVPTQGPRRVATNRGASGIDGLVATAAGYARGTEEPTTLVIGDQALLHDLNSLALVAKSPVPVVVVLINNRGGGIFHFLPVAEHHEIFELCFAAPQRYDFSHAAGQFGLAHTRVDSREAFTAAYLEARHEGWCGIIEVVTNRETNVDLHRSVEQAVRDKLD